MERYPALEQLMKVEGITRAGLAECLNVRYATVIDKLKGRSTFSYDEAEKIKNTYFPGKTLEEIFSKLPEEAG